MEDKQNIAAWCSNEAKKMESLRNRFPHLNLVNQKWEILNFIASCCYQENKVYVSDVYHALDYPRESVIRAIDDLVRFGTVTKLDDNIDKRRKILNLTTSAKDYFDAMSGYT